MTEEILVGLTEILNSLLPQYIPGQNGLNIVMGTIEGDKHDLGKILDIIY
jgi:methanogenic corrinoid protein MtbC1